MKNRIPNLFLIGAPKCGTTSLYRYLSVHPDIFTPDIKEPNYLIYKKLVELDASRKKLNRAIKTSDDYQKLYQSAEDEKYLLDGTIFTYCFEESQNMLKKVSPDYKAILILRNPVERFISHYQMSCNLGDVKSDIVEYVKNPMSGMGMNTIWLGMYSEHLEKIYKNLGRDNVHILLLDDLKADTEKVLADLYDFLGLSFVKPENSGTAYLRTKGMARSSALRNLYLENKLIRSIKKLLKNTSIYNLKNSINKRLYREWTAPDYIKRILYDYYIEDIDKTEELLGRSLDCWRKHE